MEPNREVLDIIANKWSLSSDLEFIRKVRDCTTKMLVCFFHKASSIY